MSRFEQISEHIHIMHAEHETDRPILAHIRGSRKSLLMDAGNSPQHAAQFQEYLQEQGQPKPDYLVLTHWHWDHTFGLPAWDVPVMAQRITAQTLRSLADLEWSDAVLRRLSDEGVISDRTISDMKGEYGDIADMRVIVPDLLFSDGLDIDLGGVTCSVEHVGGDHAEDSCFLYVKEDKTLFLGDALGPSVYDGPLSYTPAHFLRLLSKAYSYGAEIYVESHGVPTKRQAFHDDIGRWEQFARIVERFGEDPDAVARGMCDYLQTESLPDEFQSAMDYFMAGLRRKPDGIVK